MGTHPIFESDFDCLTAIKKQIQKNTKNEFPVAICRRYSLRGDCGLPAPVSTVHLVKMVERFLQVNTGAENGPAWHDDFLHTRHNPRTSLFRRLQGRVKVQQG